MKKLFALLIAVLFSTLLSAQIAYSPLVDSLKNEVTEVSVSDLLEKLSGEVPVWIGGVQYTLVSRHSNSSFNPLAAQWIYKQFEDLGLPVEYHYFNSNGENVVATITGSEYPDQQYIICAHYDDMPPGDLAPGADDNASGVVGVLETARLLKDFDLKYTVKLIAFDEEEQGLIGSHAYADEAASNGDDILGVLNLDMIAYNSDDDYEMSISTNSLSTQFTNEYTSVLAAYGFDLTYNFISTSASDHSPFWNNGYQAILAIEDWNDFNPYYHTVNDLFDNCNIPYFNQMVQSAVATMAALSMDMKMELIHEPLISGNFTADREAWLVVNSNHAVATGENSPRLYYSVDEGSFLELQPYTTVQDTFFFMIPGQVMGSKVDYYLAAQNEDATMVATLPGGGKGINPPGTIQPESFLTYIIADIYSMLACSNTVPKPIVDLQNLYDTIHIAHEGILLDLNVEFDATHTYDGDLMIYLISPGGTEIKLCVGNGGAGQNFIGTIFDDEAEIPISEGSAPFTGNYRPDEPLSTYDDLSMTGDWILRIYDYAMNDQGTLNNWCLNLFYSGDPVYIAKLEQRDVTLYQNYPNPFRDETTFAFDLPAASNVRISIIDMMGRELITVTDRQYGAGSHNIGWNASDLQQGQYFYRIQTDHYIDVKSMMIVK
ncbi:MAG: M20/M25/M40 family metallo-hydrolase [Bacteroidales bacterium]|nr:M20/M25/M40 family metallo-hydrolase [Bacteroidales bacterium]